MKSRQFGYSLLELLVALGLLVTVSAALLAPLGALRRAESASREARSATAAAARLFAVINRLVLEADGHPFRVPLRADSPADLILRDGSESPAAHLAAEGSTVVSGLEMRLSGILCISESRMATSGVEVTACEPDLFPDYTEPLPDTLVFAGASIDGLFFFQGRRLRAGSSDSCHVLALTGEPSMHLPAPPPSLASLELLIPIVRDFSILVDRRGVLRWISYRGSRLTENQPMLDGVAIFRAGIAAEPWGTQRLHVDLALHTGRMFALSFAGSLVKPDYFTGVAAATTLCRSLSHG